MSAGTPRVSVRVPPRLWAAALVKAASNNTTVSAEIVRHLQVWTTPTAERPHQ